MTEKICNCGVQLYNAETIQFFEMVQLVKIFLNQKVNILSDLLTRVSSLATYLGPVKQYHYFVRVYQ